MSNNKIKFIYQLTSLRFFIITLVVTAFIFNFLDIYIFQVTRSFNELFLRIGRHSVSHYHSEDFFTNLQNKISNLKVNSKLNLDELTLKYDHYKIKNYIKNYNNLVKLRNNKINIKYLEKKFLIDGSSEFYIEDGNKNFLNLMKDCKIR